MNIPAEIHVNGKWRPTRNSEGRLIHSTPEGLLAFWKWFGESKIVDDQGRPLVVYHGTDSDFDSFSISSTKHGSEMGYGYYFTKSRDRAGTYAKNEGARILPVYLKLLKPFSRSAERLIHISEKDAKSLALVSMAGDAPDVRHHPVVSMPFTDQLEARRLYTALMDVWKKDGENDNTQPTVVFPHRDDDPKLYTVRFIDFNMISMSTDTHNTWRDLWYLHGPAISFLLRDVGFDGIASDRDIVVFSPTQIKSATGNRGTFDGADPVLTNPRRRKRNPYSNQLAGLSRYLGEGDSDPDYRSLGYMLPRWVDEEGVELNAKANTELLTGDQYEAYELLTKKEREAFRSYVDANMMDIDPTDIPTHYSIIVSGGRGKLPGIGKRTDWLVHFTDYALDIATEGFTIGHGNEETLAVTSYRQGRRAYTDEGWNFAFDAQGREAGHAAAKRKYGKEAVLFQSASVNVYHTGDEENQAIFWGPDVKTLIPLRKLDGDWAVETNKTGRVLVRGGFSDVVKWVTDNYRQYAKHIVYRVVSKTRNNPRRRQR